MISEGSCEGFSAKFIFAIIFFLNGKQLFEINEIKLLIP